ncbi:hypothetical protein [Sicyoidochytrium minutum DNA virus]|nr:hypothetical protein [Sicyoidochytrium minutum DNA virus]
MSFNPAFFSSSFYRVIEHGFLYESIV